MTPVTTSVSPFMEGKAPLDIVVIGGSCAGLFIGLLLKRQGHNVHILDAAQSNEREGLAAGIGLAAQVKRFFDENDRIKHIPFGVPNDNMQILGYNMNIQTEMPIGMNMTTWEATYYRLRANFDAFKSAHCPEPPDLSSDKGTGVFETGRAVLRVEESKTASGKLEVVAEDPKTMKTKLYHADAVIAADGFNSNTRRQLQPNVHRTEPGYVLWRGTIPEKDLSPPLWERLAGRTFLYRMQYSYAIIYTIPGPNGTLEPGTRHLNIAWYTWETRSSIKAILTDTTGHTHRTTLPKGRMRPEIWQDQLTRARKAYHPDMFELVTKIDQPFVTLVSSLVSEKATHFDNRLFIIGDALCQKQPNTGIGVSMAAKNAIELGEVFAGKVAPEEWEWNVLEEGRRERLRSVWFPAWFLNGWLGWLWLSIRYRWLLAGQGRWAEVWGPGAHRIVQQAKAKVR